MIKNNNIKDKRIKYNNRIFLKKNIIQLYNSLKKYKTSINIDAHFIRQVNEKYFIKWIV